MPFNYCGTKRPHEALLNLYIDKNLMIVERRREPQGANGTPPFVIFKSNSNELILLENRVWWSVCLGQAPAKR